MSKLAKSTCASAAGQLKILLVKDPITSSKYRHIYASTAAASPATPLARSEKEESYDAIFTVTFQNGSVLEVTVTLQA